MIPPAVADDPLLRLSGITQRFPGVTALAGVDLDVRAGEIHALLGENGAGKSTLIKVLTGVHRPEAGTMRLAGVPLRPHSPRGAEEAGVSTVYQEINLVPSLSVAENITLGRQPGHWGWINWRAIRRRARAALDRLGLDCDLEAELGTLPVALQQMVAIARALDTRLRLLVLDEPTASLDEAEVAELFRVMRQLRSEGIGILFVTHFLDQVDAVGDRLTVLRNGALVGTYPVGSLSRLELVAKMLGRELAATAGGEPIAGAAAAGTPCLEARGLGRRGAIAPFDLLLRAGEVTGLAGLLGAGRTESARLLFGVDAADTGEIRLAGKAAIIGSPRDAVRLGIAFCSEDRKAEGILPNLSVRENLIIALQAKRGLRRALSPQEQSALCGHYIRALRIKTTGPDAPMRTLSGGNQQKVLLARWLATQPQIMLLDEPTRGIDVGAKAEIEQLIAGLRDDGMAVLFISSEIEEVVRNCQRVRVLRSRRFTDEVTGAEVSVESLMRRMGGGHESA